MEDDKVKKFVKERYGKIAVNLQIRTSLKTLVILRKTCRIFLKSLFWVWDVEILLPLQV
jgi:hypothetical protein